MADAAVGCIMLSCGGPRSVLIERECSGVGVGRTKSGIMHDVLAAASCWLVWAEFGIWS